MTDNLTADPKRSQRSPADNKRQGMAGVSRQAAVPDQTKQNNTAGRSVPAALHGNPEARSNAPQRSGQQRPQQRPQGQQCPQSQQRPQGQQRPSANPPRPVARPAAGSVARQQVTSGRTPPQRNTPPSPASREQLRGKATVNIKPAERKPAVSRQVPQRNVQNRVAQRPSAETRTVQNRPIQARPSKTQAQTKNAETPKVKLPVKTFVLFGIILVAIIAITSFLVFLIGEQSLIKKKVTVEIGTSANFSMFIENEPKYPQYLSTNLDFAGVDYSQLQSVFFTITLYGIDHECELVIADTTPPTGEAVTQELMSVDPIPEASKCITRIEDKTPVTASWVETPDISAGGEFVATAKLTDAAGNETLIYVPLSVTRDSVAPVIEGYRDLSVIVGETISYRTGIVVTDNYDKNPRLEIDTSGVKLDKPGDYKAVLKAYDFTGNKSEVTINVKIKAKPKNYIEPDMVYAQAKEIYEKITTPEMSNMEKALQIVWWVRQNVKFTVKIKPKSWTEGAYYGFKDRRGNCLTSASCVKAMLDVAGIENMFVTRWPYKVAKHYWNYVKIDGQWYHCDATWRQNYDSYFFMYTTKELLAFWHDGWNGFEFDQKKYPESATASVQKKIDYKNHKIKS